jgi:predicted nucleotidyltransferase
MLHDSLKNRIVERIKSVSSPVRVILFGSYAYGSPRPGSDIDILVIEEKINSKMAEINKLLTALRDIPFPKDIIVASQDEYDFYSKEAGSVFRTVAEKGVVIYG